MTQTLRETLYEAESLRRLLAETPCDERTRDELVRRRSVLVRRAKTARLLSW